MNTNGEKRMAGDYVITHALHIGDREIVLGENPAGAGDERYMCAFCETNTLLASYTEVMVSDDYPELVKLFGERVAEQAEKTRIELNGPKLQGIPNDPITAEGCEVIGHGHDLRGKVVVIRPEVLHPEYRRATCQLHLCIGGFGASPNSRGSACSCTELYSGKTSRFERRDILGIIAPEKLPQWAKHLSRLRRKQRTGRAVDMDDRVKAGYTITDSIQIGETEFVLGKRGGSFPMYVTWACKGGDNYYWGHYFGDLLEAQKDLLSRAGEELEYQMMRQGKSDNVPKQKESEGHER